ncbi:MAG: hypothetical protein AAFQ98_17730 [Bacteroidota bacterium]
MTWKFFLVGRKFDSTGFIERMIKTNTLHGETSLIYNDEGRIKVYAKKWSEIFNEFEIRHNFINEKLLLEREQLMVFNDSVEEIVSNSINNTARGNNEISLPS